MHAHSHLEPQTYLPFFKKGKQSAAGRISCCALQFNYCLSLHTRGLCALFTHAFWYRHEVSNISQCVCKCLILGGQFCCENSAGYMRKLKLAGSYLAHFSCAFEPASFSCDFCRVATQAWIQLHLSLASFSCELCRVAIQAQIRLHFSWYLSYMFWAHFIKL